MFRANLYIIIVSILPTIGEYMLVGFIVCYWIYSAINWGGMCQLEGPHSRIFIYVHILEIEKDEPTIMETPPFILPPLVTKTKIAF